MSASVSNGSGRSPAPTRRDPERTVRRPVHDTPSPFPGLGGFVVPGFEVLGEIARGGMGVVFSARELALGREVAIKTLLPELAGDALAAARFASEVRITARLPHPGVPPVYHLGALADGRPYMAMKLIRGRTLAAVLAARWQRPASLSTDDLDLTAPDSPGALQILEQVCQAVGFAHAKGVVHRDLKPANVMVGPFGEVQVMDWGLALDTKGRRADEFDPVPGAATGPDQVIVVHRTMFVAEGTPAYMAPEQARGEPVDARADVFALGGVLCAILTGRPPFTGRDADDVLRRARLADLDDAHDRLDRSDAAPELVALAKACLSPNPVDRPPDAGVMTGILIAQRTGWEERQRECDRAQAAAVARSGEARKTAWAAARAEHEAAARSRLWRAVVVLVVLSSILAAVLALTQFVPEKPIRIGTCPAPRRRRLAGLRDCRPSITRSTPAPRRGRCSLPGRA